VLKAEGNEQRDIDPEGRTEAQFAQGSTGERAEAQHDRDQDQERADS